MNCIAQARIPPRSAKLVARVTRGVLRRPFVLSLLLAVSGCAIADVEPVPEKIYDVMYTVTPLPKRGAVRVEMRVSQARRLLRELSMSMPEERFSDVRGDGEIIRETDRVRWLPGHEGGTLRWSVKVANRRYGDSYDAWLGRDWGLFRAADIIPPASSRTVVGAHSRTRFQFDLPDDWSAVTEYADRRGVYTVKTSERRFDRPTGWIVVGKLGVRIENIAGVRVVVAGPEEQGVRRLDILAFLHWTLPELVKVLPDFPKRLAIVSATDSMWRGGLSAPSSLYIHAGLPLISENATSTLLHEVIHIGVGLRAADGADWIVEGLAEYYGLEILRRSRSISQQRFGEAISDLIAWGKKADKLCARASTAATTARAVGVFAALDRQLQKATMSTTAMDELLRQLIRNGEVVSVSDLRRIATDLAGSLPRALSTTQIGACG